MRSVSITNFTRHTRSVAGAPFKKVADAVLPSWDISLAFVGPAKARALNESLRGKTYTPNVLSYAAGPRSGEVIICLAEAVKQAPAYGMADDDFVLYLFIHALLHLKGLPHGATMEKREQMLLAKFSKSGAKSLPHETENSHRYRHRHVPGKNGRRRGDL